MVEVGGRDHVGPDWTAATARTEPWPLQHVPDVALTTDIIVSFPGESEKDWGEGGPFRAAAMSP